ncbi:binding-protein-dependent transporter [Salmonella enterica subsp. enterica serovar Madelia]|nr:binding-protein-dependent transporter [Salmonella enterica subsp. enterica serovar Madelia]
MGAYLIRRLLLVIPTLWAIITINFFIVQIAPGGPVDQAIAAIEFGQGGALPGASGGRRSRQSCANRRRQYQRQPLSRRPGTPIRR